MSPADDKAALALSVCFHASRLHFRLRALGDATDMLAPGGGSTIGVLKSLAEAGPATVPELARMRPVSRQHIQTIVNHLMDKGWVKVRPNPRHKRSGLVALTAKGRRALNDMLADATRLAGDLAGKLDAADLRKAERALKGLISATAEAD